MSKLTKREAEVVELVAWGAAQKEVADQLGISRFTVDNILRSAKEKLHLQKINEISAWYFCNRFHISMNLSPLKKQIVTACLLGLVMVQIGWMDSSQYARTVRSGRARTAASARVRTRSKE